MGIHTSTISIIEDQKRCEAVVAALLLDYNKEYIKRHFKITRQQLDHIIDIYNLNENQEEMQYENERLRTCKPDAVQG